MKMTVEQYNAFLAEGGKNPKRHKYSAKRAYRCASCDGAVMDKKGPCPSCRSKEVLSFDSRAEARRWDVLRQREKAGLIVGLRRQVAFNLTTNGVKIGGYVADFLYLERGAAAYTVEDVKGVDTPLSHWKRRHLEAEQGVRVRVVKKGEAG